MQTNVLQLLDRQQQMENTSCCTEARLASALDQMHLMTQVHKLAVSAAGFSPTNSSKKRCFYTSVLLLHAPSQWNTASFLPAGTSSEPSLAMNCLTVLTPEHHQEDYDTSWQDTGRCWSEVGLCLQFSVFEIREPAHSFIADIIYLTTVSCKRAEHSKAQKEGLNFSSNWCPSPEQFRRLNTHVNKLCLSSRRDLKYKGIGRRSGRRETQNIITELYRIKL